MFIIATVVVIVGGATVYKIKQWTRAIDEKQQREKDQPENETNISVPAMPYQPEVFVSLDRWWLEWSPDLTDGNGDPRKGIPNPSVEHVLQVLLLPSGHIVLTATNNAGWVNTDLEALSVPLDADGIPVVWGDLPAIGLSVVLEHAVDLRNWVDATRLCLKTNEPVYFESVEQGFYRVRQ